MYDKAQTGTNTDIHNINGHALCRCPTLQTHCCRYLPEPVNTTGDYSSHTDTHTHAHRHTAGQMWSQESIQMGGDPVTLCSDNRLSDPRSVSVTSVIWNESESCVALCRAIAQTIMKCRVQSGLEELVMRLRPTNKRTRLAFLLDIRHQTAVLRWQRKGSFNRPCKHNLNTLHFWIYWGTCDFTKCFDELITIWSISH